MSLWALLGAQLEETGPSVNHSHRVGGRNEQQPHPMIPLHRTLHAADRQVLLPRLSPLLYSPVAACFTPLHVQLCSALTWIQLLGHGNPSHEAVVIHSAELLTSARYAPHHPSATLRRVRGTTISWLSCCCSQPPPRRYNPTDG